MPVYIAETTKREARVAVSFLVGDYWPLTTSGAGVVGGTTAVFSSLVGLDPASIVNKYELLTSGTNTGEWRFASQFAPSTGTITVPRAHTGQIAGSVTAELHEHRPDLYTQAINQATRELYRHVWRPMLDHIIPEDYRTYNTTPRNMRDHLRTLTGGECKVRDLFDRTASTTSPGSPSQGPVWVETTGNWGIIGERLYCVSDADNDFLSIDPDLQDGVLQWDVTGTTNHDTVYRTLSLCFRIFEDKDGAIDTNNYLLVQLLGTAGNAVVDLRKVDGGTESSLTTATQVTVNGTYYRVKVQFVGTRIFVWVDSILLISYELTGQNVKYTQGRQVGIRLDKAGSPATDARADNFYAYSVENLHVLNDIEQHYDNIGLRYPAYGIGHPGNSLLHIEGKSPLTQLDADTFETPTTDTTSKLEINETDPLWAIFIQYAAYALYEQARQPANTFQEDRRQMFAQEADKAYAKYRTLLMDLGESPIIRKRTLG